MDGRVEPVLLEQGRIAFCIASLCRVHLYDSDDTTGGRIGRIEVNHCREIAEAAPKTGALLHTDESDGAGVLNELPFGGLGSSKREACSEQ